MGLWLAWSGHYTPLLLGFGVVCSLLVVWLCRLLGIVDDELLPLQLTWRTLRYLPWLAWEVVKSSLHVVGRVLRPGLPISPRLLMVKPSQKTDVGRVTYGNSITLTPGTLTLDVTDELITVHAITREAAADLETGEMDRRVARIEGPGA